MKKPQAKPADKLTAFERRLNETVGQAFDGNKFDQVLNRDQYNEHSKEILIKAEIHQLFEDDKIDAVVTDCEDGQRAHIHVTPDGKRVLCIHARCTYGQLRAVVDGTETETE